MTDRWRALLLAAALALAPTGWTAFVAPAMAQSMYSGEPIGDRASWDQTYSLLPR